MYNDNGDKVKKLSLIFKGLGICISILGLVLLFNFGNSFNMINYYTVQSNIICLILFIYMFVCELLGKEHNNKVYPVVRGACTICIIITFLIYNFVLKPQMFKMGSGYDANNLFDLIVHTIFPLMVFFDYLLFEEKGKYKYINCLYWAIIPILYAIFVYIKVLVFNSPFGKDSRFPYFFLDIDKLGTLGVIKWIIIIVLLEIVLSLIYIFIDKLLYMFKTRKN